MNPTADAAPLNPTPLGWALFVAVLAWAVCATREKNPPAAPRPNWPWWLLVAATLACFRWPLLWVPHQQNPDESQLIAGAITLWHDPVFWRSVDGGTAGPPDFFALLPAAWADGVASFAVARAISLAAIFATLVFAGETIALVAGAAVARLAVLPALAFFSFTTAPDFTHASTEVMPVLLLAAAGWLAVKNSAAPSRARVWLFAVVVGAAPWAKLQAAPLAAALWALVAWRETRPGRPAALMPLLAGALLPTFTAFAFTAATGQLEHLVVPYFLNNAAYIGAPQFSWTGNAAAQWLNATLDGYVALWLAGAVLFVAGVFALARVRTAPPPLRGAVIVALVLLAAGVVSALGPRRPSLHHVQFLLLPLGWLGGVALAVAWPALSPSNGSRARPLIVAGIFLACTLVPQLAWRAFGADPFAAINTARPSAAHAQLAELVRRFSARDEPLAIWGWRSSLYVEAGRRQATRQAHTEAQIYAGRWQRYFLQRYLEDFQAANPPVFVDAVGPGNFAFEAPQFAHEAFPPLREWVRTHYTLVAPLDGTRLFVRNDRLAAAKLALPSAPGP